MGAHEATWLGWPHCRSDWPGKLGTIEWVYGEIVRKIAESRESAHHHPRAASQGTPGPGPRPCNLANVEFFRAPSDRGWARDFGPICVRKPGPKPEVAIAKFKFTAWAKYRNWHKDNLIAERIAQQRKMRLFPVTHKGQPVVLEGGGIDVNGCGTC